MKEKEESDSDEESVCQKQEHQYKAHTQPTDTCKSALIFTGDECYIYIYKIICLSVCSLCTLKPVGGS